MEIRVLRVSLVDKIKTEKIFCAKLSNYTHKRPKNKFDLRLSMMWTERVRATASLTLGTGSQDRSSRWGSTSLANMSSVNESLCTSRLHSNAKVCRRLQRELCANCSASSANSPRSRGTWLETCFTSSVTYKNAINNTGWFKSSFSTLKIHRRIYSENTQKWF